MSFVPGKLILKIAAVYGSDVWTAVVGHPKASVASSDVPASARIWTAVGIGVGFRMPWQKRAECG